MCISVHTPKGQPIIICDKDDLDLEKKAFHCLKVYNSTIGTIYMCVYIRIYLSISQIPKVADCLQGILTVVPLQLLSFHIAVLKGYDVSENIAYAGHETSQVYLNLLSRFGVHYMVAF